jgi:integrase
LLPEIREALLDYVTNARSHTELQNIFLQDQKYRSGALKPYSVYTIVSRCFAKAPIECGSRRRGSRALRSSLATALLDEGNGYPIITRVLGQQDPRAAEHYVSVNVNHLKPCALPVPRLGADYERILIGAEVVG